MSRLKLTEDALEVAKEYILIMERILYVTDMHDGEPVQNGHKKWNESLAALDILKNKTLN